MLSLGDNRHLGLFSFSTSEVYIEEKLCIMNEENYKQEYIK